MSEVRTRILVSAILVPIALFALYYGGIPIIIALGLVSSIGSFEYITMMRKAGIRIPFYWVGISILQYLAMVYQPNFDLLLIISVLLISLIEAIIVWDNSKSIIRMFVNNFGVFYTAVFPAIIVRISQHKQNSNILLALILMIWIVDSTAYFIGTKIGKKRNITAISPRKSLEGFIAGAIAPWLILVILLVSGLNFVPLRFMVLIAFAAGIFGQLGDLVESMLKRFCDVKDSSNLIPGHGGILDRSDSILLAGSFLYCAMEILTKVR